MNENFFQLIGETIASALRKLGSSFVEVIPALVAAIIIIVIGYVIGKIAKHIIVKLIQTTRLDEWIEEQNLTAAIGGKNLSVLIGTFIKWGIVAIFLAEAVKSMQLTVLQGFLTAIANYIPQILLALIIVVVGLLIGRYIRNAIEATTYNYRKTIGLALELMIVYIAIVMALDTIEGISVTILIDAFRIAFAAFAFAIAIVVGIAFGLAFKKDAKKIVKGMKSPQ